MSNFAARLDELMERATKGPWELCEHSWSDTSVIGSGGRKVCALSIADIANEDTQDAEEKWMAADAELITYLVNHAPAIRDLVRAAEMTLATLPHMGGNEMSAHNLAMALSEAIAKLEEA